MLKRNVLMVVLALLSSLVVVAAGFVFYYQSPGRYGGTAASFDPTNLRLMVGEGENSAQGIVIRQIGARGFALLGSTSIRLSADDYNELRWNIEGMGGTAGVQFVWATRAAPRSLRATNLPNNTPTGQIKLASVEGWEGEIVGLGLRIQSLSDKPLVVRGLALQTAIPSATQLLAMLWNEWSTFEGWSGHSINFVGDGLQKALFPPVLASAAWIALAILVYGLCALLFKQKWSWQAAGAIFLVGWIALDMRWQWNLWRQLAITHQSFAGKSWEEKHLADGDGKLFEFIGEVKKHLPRQPAKVYLIAPGKAGQATYLRGRAHYHLLPHNVFSFLPYPPTLDKKLSGDHFVLVLNPPQGIRYDAARRLLRWGNDSSLPVEPLFATRVGALFRMKNAS